jgi:nitrate/TMAO reductase-like tetraheme cytochrome c subunit
MARARGLFGSLSFRALTLAGGLSLGLALIATGTAMEVSSRPAFCGSCHNMKPYYESWKISSHRNIACVDCHIPPGVTAELRKKYEALSMVARYFTGTYSTNPWTEIDDASCLQCHERRLLSGKELFGSILFDHSAHLAGMRRGKKLRCTSCHSQIVQGSHIAVTTSTCILCHFKGQAADTGTARCALCHQVPDKVITRGTLSFNHADVSRFGMECTWCHARPEGSDGAVPRERCVTCHNEPKRLAEFGNTELLHRMHVTEHKVDCLHCHLEIQHVGQPRLARAVTSCETCHDAGHSAQLDLYTGVGGKSVEPMPSPMFQAGVRCEGCHFAVPGRSAEVRGASDISCMSCHGASYRTIFLAWKDGTERRTTALERQMEQTERALAAAPSRALADARYNLNLVSRGHGIHNVEYSYALLRRSHEDMNVARLARGLPPLPLPWTEVPLESTCLRCHQGVEAQRGTISGRGFSHQPHLLKAKIDCLSCHRTHEERARGEVVRFGPSGCDSCHHREPRAECLSCHAGVRGRKVQSFRGEFDHAFHLDDAGQTCADCHELAADGAARLKKETCTACHEEPSAAGDPGKQSEFRGEMRQIGWAVSHLDPS